MDRQGAVATLTAALAAFVSEHAPHDEQWCVALSGGADSLALTAVAAAAKPTVALIVDHRLRRWQNLAHSHSMVPGGFDVMS